LLEDNFRVLLCLIEGDSTVFQVKAPINNNVLDLKDLIREKGINVQERYVLAKDLLLLKVSTISTTVSPHLRAEVVALAGRCRSQRQ
jgi:Crinkler effector protein N-terminal domain